MSEKTKLYLRLWLPVFLWAAFIFFLSHWPNLRSPWRFDYVLRKTLHVVEYLVLAMLLARAFRGSGFERGGFALALFSAAVFAASDEYHQNFIRGRHGTWKDFKLDNLGSGLGLLFYWARLRFKAAPEPAHGPTPRPALSEGSVRRLADPPRLPPSA